MALHNRELHARNDNDGGSRVTKRFFTTFVGESWIIEDALNTLMHNVADDIVV